MTAQERRCARAAAYGLGGDSLEPPDDLRGAEAGPVADLDGRQCGFQRAVVLLAVGPRPPELANWIAPESLKAATSVNCLLLYQIPAPYSRFPRTLSAAYHRSTSEAYPHYARIPSPS